MVTSVAFSRDGAILASASEDKTIKLWDVSPAKAEGVSLRTTIEEHTAPVWCLAFSPQGRMLASGGLDGFVRLWDPQNAHQLAKLFPHRRPVTALAFAPDGRTLLAGSFDGALKRWQAKEPDRSFVEPLATFQDAPRDNGRNLAGRHAVGDGRLGRNIHASQPAVPRRSAPTRWEPIRCLLRCLFARW